MSDRRLFQRPISIILLFTTVFCVVASFNFSLSASAEDQPPQQKDINSLCKSIKASPELSKQNPQSLTSCKARDAIDKAKPGLMVSAVADAVAAAICFAEFELLTDARNASRKIVDPTLSIEERASTTLKSIPPICGAAGAVDGVIEAAELVKQTTDKSGSESGVAGKTSLGMQGFLGVVEGGRISACAFGSSESAVSKIALCPKGSGAGSNEIKLDARIKLAKQSAIILGAMSVMRGVDIIVGEKNKKSLEGNINSTISSTAMITSNTGAAGHQLSATGGTSTGYNDMSTSSNNGSSTTASNGYNGSSSNGNSLQNGETSDGSGSTMAATAAYDPILKPGSPLRIIASDVIARLRIPENAAYASLASGGGGILNMIFKTSKFRGIPPELSSIKNELENNNTSLNFQMADLGNSTSSYAPSLGVANSLNPSQSSTTSNARSNYSLSEAHGFDAEPTAVEGDVWHSNSAKNIFQIVSDRYDTHHAEMLK